MTTIRAGEGTMFGKSNRKSDTDLDSEDFKQGFSQTDDALLIDVRTPGEYDESHIPGSRNIDMYSPTFMQEIEQLDRKAPIYLYCRSGNRSGTVLSAMKQIGFEKVYHLAHGILDWNGETE
jgi:rhodanese-related sulfurtransferase